jgi:hypothetical protein
MMKHAKWFVLLVSVPAFAQGLPSGNVASGALDKRMNSLDLLKPQAGIRASLSPLMTEAIRGRRSATPSICAVPLLNAKPQGDSHDRMQIAVPETPMDKMNVRVPAPACDEGLFRNR